MAEGKTKQQLPTDPTQYTILKEGEADILVHGNDVFYNKTQVVNRDLSIAVLRTFVVELYANCTPKHSWANGGILPVRQPPTTNAPYKQMGIVPEWGDMLAAISPDGNYVVVATNQGPPEDTRGCAGYGYVLQDNNNEYSGQSARTAQWCSLAKNSTTGQITCDSSMNVLDPGAFTPPNPPGSNPVPSFISMGGQMTVIFNLNWSQYKTADYWQIWQNNLGADYQQFFFGTNGNTIGAVQPIYTGNYS